MALMWKKSSQLVALLVGTVGIVDIVSALWPPVVSRWHILRAMFPIEILHLSRTLTLLTGIFLVVIAQALLRRKKRAWIVSIVLLSLTLALHLIKGLDVEEFTLTAVALLVLVAARPLFVVDSDRLAVFSAMKTASLILGFLFLYTLGGYTLMRTQFVGPYNLQSVPQGYVYESLGVGRDVLRAETQWARWFEESISVVGVVSVGIIMLALFAPVFDRGGRTEEDSRLAHEIVQKYGQDEVTFFALMPDKDWWFSDDRRAMVAYKRIQNKVVVLGPPIGAGAEAGAVFNRVKKQAGVGVIWYNVDESVASRLPGKKIKVGESATIDLEHYSLGGATIADVRHAVTHLDRAGVSFSWYAMDEIPWRELSDIDLLHRAWVGSKTSPALTFSLGFYPFPVISQGEVLVVRASLGELWAVLSFYPVGGSGYTLDLMMRAPNSPNGTMEGAVNQAAIHYQSRGMNFLNLGMAPLADTVNAGESRGLKKIRSTLFNHMGKLYDYKALYKFKNKFLPRWTPRYLVVEDYASLPTGATAVLSAHLQKGQPK